MPKLQINSTKDKHQLLVDGNPVDLLREANIKITPHGIIAVLTILNPELDVLMEVDTVYEANRRPVSFGN